MLEAAALVQLAAAAPCPPAHHSENKTSENIFLTACKNPYHWASARESPACLMSYNISFRDVAGLDLKPPQPPAFLGSLSSWIVTSPLKSRGSILILISLVSVCSQSSLRLSSLDKSAVSTQHYLAGTAFIPYKVMSQAAF